MTATTSFGRAAVALLAAGTLTACVSPTAGSDGNYATPIGNASVTANPTPYSSALVCLADYARREGLQPPRVAVGRIADYTGKAELEGGRKITQGASLMAISAFAKAGARLVERFDTSVSELELKYANNKLITDDGQDYRRILAGSVPGSDFYLVGGVTELNYNIRSIGGDVFAGDIDADPAGRASAKLYVMNIGLDLRLVETKSLEVVDVVSYQKQIIGREVSAGLFGFFDDVIVDVGVGERALEPLQLGVRSVVERAVLEMTANLYGVDGPAICALHGDPLGPEGFTGDFEPTTTALLETNNGQTRADPYAWLERERTEPRSLRTGGRPD